MFHGNKRMGKAEGGRRKNAKRETPNDELKPAFIVSRLSFSVFLTFGS
jgi:hypothetical protein